MLITLFMSGVIAFQASPAQIKALEHELQQTVGHFIEEPNADNQLEVRVWEGLASKDHKITGYWLQRAHHHWHAFRVQKSGVVPLEPQDQDWDTLWNQLEQWGITTLAGQSKRHPPCTYVEKTEDGKMAELSLWPTGYGYDILAEIFENGQVLRKYRYSNRDCSMTDKCPEWQSGCAMLEIMSLLRAMREPSAPPKAWEK